MSLWSEFLNNQGRPIRKWTHYFPIYERHLEGFRNGHVTLLEIGCGDGGSLQMWKRWLGPLAKIVGLDNRPECRAFEENQIYVRIGDQKDPEVMSALLREFGAFDIIVDDGSHVMEDIAASFDRLYFTMPKSGVYIVEDLHTAYWPEYGGGLRRGGTFIEVAKDLVDRLNAYHVREGLTPDRFTNGTWGMHFYDSVIVFERGRRPVVDAVVTGVSPPTEQR